MPLKLMYLTNQEKCARIAEDSGVDWIFVDLEVLGKEERQGHLNAVISHHSIKDVRRIKRVLTKAKLLVRVNPIYEGSQEEIDTVIKDGADMVMLPMFTSRDEVAAFLGYVNGRAETILLCETAKAVENIADILNLGGIDAVHIGLNDLHLSYGMDFMFEPLSDGTVDMLCHKFRKKGIPYGFGGIASLGHGLLPAEYILAEHYRLKSSMVILSRSFIKPEELENDENLEAEFHANVEAIRAYEAWLATADELFFENNHSVTTDRIQAIKLKMMTK